MRTESAIRKEIARLRKVNSDKAFGMLLALQWALGSGNKNVCPSSLSAGKQIKLGAKLNEKDLRSV